MTLTEDSDCVRRPWDYMTELNSVELPLSIALFLEGFIKLAHAHFSIQSLILWGHVKSNRSSHTPPPQPQFRFIRLRWCTIIVIFEVCSRIPQTNEAKATELPNFVSGFHYFMPRFF